MANIATREKGKRPEKSDQTKISKHENTVQLPLWPNVVRALPNAFARSALFTVGNRNKPRSSFVSVEIATVNGIRITYSGEELRQDDEDVLLQLLHQARQRNLSDYIEFSSYSILKSLGWTMNTSGYARLQKTITRLDATGVVVHLEDESIKFSGALVRKFIWHGEKWRIYLEPEIVYLFGDTNYTHLYWELRLSLSPLAKWFHSFFSTHKVPFSYKLSTFRELTATQHKTTSGFKKEVKRALQELVDKEFLSSFEIDKTGLVHVIRKPSAVPLEKQGN
ncbi:MAG: plasmid replication initiator TrfA [Candidatus Nanopelagicales bacterium]